MMTSKAKNTLFRRKNRNSSSSQTEPPAETSNSPTAATAMPTTTDASIGNKGSSNYRGADAINADAAKNIRALKKSTSDGVRSDLDDHVAGISPGLNELLSPSEKKDAFELGPRGGHFLEPSVQHLHDDFLEKWKKEMLFPVIQHWVDLYMVDHMKDQLHQRTEAVIQKYEKTIAAIEEKHKQEIIELERVHKELLVTVVRKTWADYEQKMQNARIVKAVHFGFHPSDQKEPWADDIQDVVPEVRHQVPQVYEPTVGLEDHPSEHNASNFHGHHRLNKYSDSAALPEGHDSGVMEQPPVTRREEPAAQPEPLQGV